MTSENIPLGYVIADIEYGVPPGSVGGVTVAVQHVVTKIFDGEKFVPYDSFDGIAVRNKVLLSAGRAA